MESATRRRVGKKIALVWYKKKKRGKTHSVNPREEKKKFTSMV
jgi:hypothetical protein